MYMYIVLLLRSAVEIIMLLCCFLSWIPQCHFHLMFFLHLWCHCCVAELCWGALLGLLCLLLCRLAMKLLDKKRIKAKKGEYLAVNERNMLAKVSLWTLSYLPMLPSLMCDMSVMCVGTFCSRWTAHSWWTYTMPSRPLTSSALFWTWWMVGMCTLCVGWAGWVSLSVTKFSLDRKYSNTLHPVLSN